MTEVETPVDELFNKMFELISDLIRDSILLSEAIREAWALLENKAPQWHK